MSIEDYEGTTKKNSLMYNTQDYAYFPWTVVFCCELTHVFQAGFVGPGTVITRVTLNAKLPSAA